EVPRDDEGPIDHRGEIEVEHVPLDDVETLVRKALAQECREAAIDLDDGELRQPCEERLGERAASRSDLHHGAAVAQIERGDDPRDRGGIGQEVLPEPAPGGRGRPGGPSRRRGDRRARLIARHPYPSCASTASGEETAWPALRSFILQRTPSTTPSGPRRFR